MSSSTSSGPEARAAEHAAIDIDVNEIIVLDTETTGLDHKSEKLIEIAACRLVDGEVVDTFTSLVNPQQEIRHSSFLIHNISQEMVEEAPNIDEVLPKFLEYMGDLPYVAHNALFDYSFINEACKATLGERFKNPRVDTFEMYRSVFPDEHSHGLSSLLDKFKFDSHVNHRALDDAMCLAKVYPKLRALYEQKYAWQISQFDNVPYLLERYLRLQKSIQMMQSEMSDLKDLFKLYFDNNGSSVEATTGELMVSNYRRSYSYDDRKVWDIALEMGIHHKIFKVNPRAIDKLIDRAQIPDEARDAFIEARLSMNESRQVSFIKPQPKILEDEVNGAEPQVAIEKANDALEEEAK